MHWIATGLLALLLVAPAAAAIVRVGPSETITRIADAARLAQDGDTVLILPGEYRGDVAVWRQKQLTIRGAGERPVLIADGASAEGKAIWVIRDGDFVIENIEFRGARVTDGNGAGIRFERGRLEVRACAFVDNQNGLLTGNHPAAELVVRDSLFAEAPRPGHVLPHLLYVGRIARFELTGSRFHNGYEGHLVKSRARVSDIRYNLLYDGPHGGASYELEFPNGGVARVVGNVIGQGADTKNPVVVAYGAEGPAWPENALHLSHNTLTSERSLGAWFLRVWSGGFANGIDVRAVNNLTAGLGVFTLGARGAFHGNYPALQGVLSAPDVLDFTLAEDSILRNRGVDPVQFGDARIVPAAEFSLPIGTRPLPHPAHWTPGAFQTRRYSE
jgi:hypothetical protein